MLALWYSGYLIRRMELIFHPYLRAYCEIPSNVPIKEAAQ